MDYESTTPATAAKTEPQASQSKIFGKLTSESFSFASFMRKTPKRHCFYNPCYDLHGSGPFGGGMVE